MVWLGALRTRKLRPTWSLDLALYAWVIGAVSLLAGTDYANVVVAQFLGESPVTAFAQANHDALPIAVATVSTALLVIAVRVPMIRWALGSMARQTVAGRVLLLGLVMGAGWMYGLYVAEPLVERAWITAPMVLVSLWATLWLARLPPFRWAGGLLGEWTGRWFGRLSWSLRNVFSPDTRSLEQLRAMSPEDFEQWVASRFRKAGYAATVVGARGGGGDDGIDVVASRSGLQVVAQAKRFGAGNSVGAPVLRELAGVLINTGSARAYLVTTGTVTPQAREWASTMPIVIVDHTAVVGWVPD
ncbi:MAG: restriction endonuclease [Chloroflexi bacterium]|nr:restriction endonuclease [Chloroflexota bacterium]